MVMLTSRTATVPVSADLDDRMRALYERHAQPLLRFLTRLTLGQREVAEDLLQETMLRAWHHPEAMSATGEWSRAWLYTVARRIAIDHMRAVSARPIELRDERLADRPEPDDQFDRVTTVREVRVAVASLPPRLRSVLIEIYFRGLSIAQAAKVLSVPEGTVKSRCYYALRALRVALAERGFYAHGSDPP